MERLNNCGWCFLLIAMAGDLIVSFVLSLFYGGYSNMKMSISVLGNPASPVRIPFNIWMLVEGILFLLALPAIYNRFHQVSIGVTNTMLVFIAAFAVGACIFTCFFSVNETKDTVTVASRIHGVGSVVGFMLFLFVPLLMAILSFKGQNGVNGVISVISFILAIVSFSLFVMSDKPEFGNSIIGNEGLWQRLNLAFMYLPLAVVSIENIVKNN